MIRGEKDMLTFLVGAASFTEIEDISYDDEGYFELADKKGGIVKRFYNYLFIRDTVHKLHKLLKFPF
jgi:hypothetical protein